MRKDALRTHLPVGEFKAREVSWIIVPLRPNIIKKMSDEDVEMRLFTEHQIKDMNLKEKVTVWFIFVQQVFICVA